MPEYVALEGIKEGNRFYCGYTPGKDPTKLADGTVAYKVLGFADTPEEALALVREGDPRSEEQVLSDYLFKTGRGLFSREQCDRYATLLKRFG